VWLPDLPNPEDELRQGDFLADVPFPQGHPRPGSLDTAPAPDLRLGLVLEHCCDIAQDHVVTIAQVRERKVRAGSQQERMLRMSPSDHIVADDGVTLVNYPVGLHLVETPADGPAPRAGRMWIAQLHKTVIYDGDLSWLRAERVARMTPEARRALRARLAIRAGRPEGEDVAYFLERGDSPTLA